MRRVKEPGYTPQTGDEATHPLQASLRRLAETLKGLRSYRQAALMLLAWVIYNDGINTIISNATLYGTTLGFSRDALIVAVLLVQFVGIPFSFAFGALAGRIGPKASILIGLAMYTCISVFAYTMTTVVEFYILAMLVATVQGGTQALSRSLFASMIPKQKASEFFGFFSIFDKFAGILGPMVFGTATVLTGSLRNGILSLIAFFVVGGIILLSVNVAAGRKEAEH